MDKSKKKMDVKTIFSMKNVAKEAMQNKEKL